MSKIQLVQVVSQVRYYRGKNTDGASLMHVAGVRYLILAGQKLSDEQLARIQQAYEGTDRGCIDEKTLAELNRAPSPLVARKMDVDFEAADVAAEIAAKLKAATPFLSLKGPALRALLEKHKLDVRAVESNASIIERLLDAGVTSPDMEPASEKPPEA
jgi:hypothetical protein